MFVNLSPSISFFSPLLLNFVRQDRLRVVVSCVALAILLAGTVYCIAFHFWQSRRVERQDGVNEQAHHAFYGKDLEDDEFDALIPGDEYKDVNPFLYLQITSVEEYLNGII
jgi:hypothetical protein